MTDLVIDASALAEYLVASPTGRAVGELLGAFDGDVHVPHLCIVETMSVFRGWVLRGELRADRAQGALQDLHDLPARRWPADPFITRIWDLRDNVTAYDAAYVALAEALDATLVTADGRLARGAEKHGDCAIALVPTTA